MCFDIKLHNQTAGAEKQTSNCSLREHVESHLRFFPSPPPPTFRASLWSSCVVLPLLALTWMSAVLAITDRRSALFQILFAVFDSLEGFIIVMVHCILRREVRKRNSKGNGNCGATCFLRFYMLHQRWFKCICLNPFTLTNQVQEAVKCRVVDRKDDGNGDSGSSHHNGHSQHMVNFLAYCLFNVLSASCILALNEYVHILSTDRTFLFFYQQSDSEKDGDSSRQGEPLSRQLFFPSWS